MNKKLSLPEFGRRLFERFIPHHDREAFFTAVGEVYSEKYVRKGRMYAHLWFWWQFLKSLPSFMFGTISGDLIMLKNYLKITIRTITKQKVYTVISIGGLAMGIACCILAFLWVYHELSYDKFHGNADHIYRIISEKETGDQTFTSAVSPNAAGPTLKEQYPEVIDFTRYRGGFTGFRLEYDEFSSTNDRIAAADPAFFKIFSFQFIQGNPETALENRSSIVITKRLAFKYFGDDDPMGKVMRLVNQNLKVTGIIKNVPENSHLQFDYIYPLEDMAALWNMKLESWEKTQTHTYVQLAKNASVEKFGKKIENITQTYHPDTGIKRLFLQPLKDIHLHSGFTNDVAGHGSMTVVFIFIIISLGVLIIACINFMNLSTARSAKRAREVGMRKVTGAKRTDLIIQFFGESILISFLALLIAILLAYLFLPVFNELSGKNLSINYYQDIPLVLGIVGITILTGLISGSYPALFLSSFQPVNVLKNSFTPKSGRYSPLRKVLVVTQFTFSIILIIISIVIHNQLRFMVNTDLGFTRENLVYFGFNKKFITDFEAAKNELLQNPDILSVTGSFPPTGLLIDGPVADVSWKGKDPEKKVAMYAHPVDYDYLNTFDIELVRGRFFSKDLATDKNNYVINETAAAAMGMESPVGKRLTINGKEGTIIGVLKDFHQGSLRNEIQPMVFENKTVYAFVTVKITTGRMAEAIDFLESKWQEYEPGYPFTYYFIDESIKAFYENEQRTGRVFRYFTFLAIFIACLGLLGLSSFTSQQRTKEIGIRKVMGASFFDIVSRLSKEFMVWIAAANLIAWPVAYYATNRWLENFAYRTEVNIGTFIFSGGIVLAIAFLTISFQTIKAATANPVRSLRYE